MLSLKPEPTVVCCNGVCNARILSIVSVPNLPTGPGAGQGAGQGAGLSLAGGLHSSLRLCAITDTLPLRFFRPAALFSLWARPGNLPRSHCTTLRRSELLFFTSWWAGAGAGQL